MGAFRRQSWDEAMEKFHQCIENLGEDGPSLFYVALCAQYKDKEDPPEEPWDGVVRIEKKEQTVCMHARIDKSRRKGGG
jgi:hypothetical protein